MQEALAPAGPLVVPVAPHHVELAANEPGEVRHAHVAGFLLAFAGLGGGHITRLLGRVQLC